VDDERGNRERPASFGVLVNGDLVKSVRLSLGEKAARLSVPVKEGDSLKLTIEGQGGVFAEPRLIKGSPTPSGAATATGPGATPQIAPAAAPFVVDPNDLDKLAVALRKRVDASPGLQQRVESGRLALVTFTLVDVPSPSVATNVAEDLSTALINNAFNLVERGQLDKILKELKIQDTALIDPATAQKIGQLSGCDVILVGSISDRGQFVVINARLMETATGKSLAAERVEMRKIPINRG
jgi:TolB-like protein